MNSSGLNQHQQEAVEYIGGPLLVLAGAGSGKTRVITQKIAWLIREADIPARNILAVTFTNKAAREMKNRVSELLDSKLARGLKVSTFHQLGLGILRSELHAAGLKPGFTLLDEQDTTPLIRELLKNNDNDRAARVRWQISGWKNAMVTPEQALSTAEDKDMQQAASVYADYERSLRAYNAVDFDDLIWLPVRLFEQHSEVLEKWQSRVRYMLVDEYQDTDNSQYRLVRLLTGVRQAFTVVGDDDQSIYAWRGANPQNLLQLSEDFPRLKVIMLEQNYRSVSSILNAANALISNNPHVFEKKLWSTLGEGERIRVIQTKDEEHEAERIVSEILTQKFQGHPLGDIAILYRGNHQARVFEKTLRQHDLPYFLSGGTSFFSRAEVKDAMSYLRLMANPDDNTAFLRIVNVPRREIGATTLEKLGSYANRRNTGLLAACNEFGLQEIVDSRRLRRLREFHDWMTHHQRRAREERISSALLKLLQEIDYMDILRERSSSEQVAERRWENVLELVEWLQRLEEQEKTEPDEIVNHLMLQDILERQDEENSHDRVALMTLHAAKGLEFPLVYLVGMEEELLPHRTSIEEETIEEERRLAYVGITRARRRLVMSLAEKRRRYGEWIFCEPSRFLGEIPDEFLLWEGEQQQKQQTRETGMAHLANLRQMLANS